MNDNVIEFSGAKPKEKKYVFATVADKDFPEEPYFIHPDDIDFAVVVVREGTDIESLDLDSIEGEEIDNQLYTDILTLPEGDVLVDVPDGLSRESLIDMADWFNILIRKYSRAE